MSVQTEPVTSTDVLDYSGQAFYIGATFGKSKTLSLAQARNGNKIVPARSYVMANEINGDSPSQSVVTADASLSAATKTSYTPDSQNVNYTGIHYKQWTQSYDSLSTSGGRISGEPVKDARSTIAATLGFQATAHMKQLMADLNYEALYGTAQPITNSATAGATGGVLTAVEAGSETAAGGASLSKTLIRTEIERMAAAGAEFVDMVILANAYQYGNLTDLYGNALESRNEGGVEVTRLLLPIAGSCQVIYEPGLATDDLAFIDLAHLQPVFNEVPEKGLIFIEDIAKIAAGVTQQLYTQFGIDYHDIAFHGMVSGLATS